MKTTEIPFAIFEALNLMGCSSSQEEYFINHLTKLLDNYNPIGVSISFLVSYLKCPKKKFDECYGNYKKLLKRSEVTEFKSSVIREHQQAEQYLYCLECDYQCGNSIFTVYSIFVHINE